ncbi:ribosomal protein S10 [Polychaeton citri CBS 116435]|uniref:Small ribosomal subunit protein uS10m n=1 Tax=Polychaeton citri CBS 116435 TaxID=1314669 RepID=A0A9P4ULM0_9PEZI|nr:ribosomal protein S10 [Polychaeton citri CBS 116435]
MATPSYVRSLVSSAKRLRLDSTRAAFSTATRQKAQQQRLPWHADTNEAVLGEYVDKSFGASPNLAVEVQKRLDQLMDTEQGRLIPLRDRTSLLPKDVQDEIAALRLPKAVQAAYMKPLKWKSTHGVTVADLQLRSYSVRNLEVFADFCLRAAYYLKLPVKGPVNLPRITERWTVPRSNFVHKKSQENFERVTMRRLIQIQDGHPETVSLFLAFIQKHQFYGVGMKANVFETSKLDVHSQMDKEADQLKKSLDEKFDLFGGRKDLMEGDEKAVERALLSEPFKGAWGAYAPMGGAQSVPNANKRIEKRTIGGGYS